MMKCGRYNLPTCVDLTLLRKENFYEHYLVFHEEDDRKEGFTLYAVQPSHGRYVTLVRDATL